MSGINRKTPIARKTRLRSSPLKAKKRGTPEFKRIHESGDRVEWVNDLGCLICQFVPAENAHVGNGGLSRKASSKRVVPLCGDFARGHHREYDGGKRSFVAKYARQLGGLSMVEHADRVEAAWRLHLEAAA